MTKSPASQQPPNRTEPEPRAWVPVFTDEALERLHRRSDPPLASAAEFAGPWQVRPHPGGGFAVTRAGDPEAGVEPYARFADRRLAFLAAAALPGLGGGADFRVEPEASEDGFRLLRAGVEVGSARVFLADLTPVLEALEALLRSPGSLAQLLEAAGATVLERAGQELGLSLAGTEAGARRLSTSAIDTQRGTR